MATYHISHTYDGKTISQQHARKRRDAAALLARKLTYEMIKGNARLDTEAGWRAMREIEKAEAPGCNEAVAYCNGEQVHFWRG